MSASTSTISPVPPRGRVGPLITRQAMLLAAILLFIAFAVTAGSFASPGNLGNILRQMASVLVLGLAMTMAVIARHVVDHQQAGLGSPGIDELRWKKPVYPGDTLHVHGKILETTPSRSRPEMGSFRTQTTVTNQDGAIVMTFVSIVLIRRKPAR